MAGPSTFVPQRDGFDTLITFALAPAVALFEREVTPPALDGGGPIESTHMRRAVWRMKDPKTLITLGDLTATVMYATSTWPTIRTMINTPQLISIRWPDTATLAFYGYLDKFTPSGHSEGNLPTANLVIVPTLYNPSTGAEVIPVFTAGILVRP